ncbi:MAG TPA: ribonuclease HI family protein [Candidatus Angelobacter sp.]
MKQRSLFADSAAPSSVPIAYIDGGARGNPGPAAYGVVIRTPEGKMLAELAKYLGERTNNFAEYSGLLAALEYAQQQNFPGLKVFSDSELLVKQMKGEYKVSNATLKMLHSQAQDLVRKLQHFSIHHVLRSYNRQADALVNAVLDLEEKKLKR